MEGWKLVMAGGVIALAGMAVGASLFGAQPVVAQSSGWRDCFIARQESVDTGGSGTTERVDLGHVVLVPAGYEPVGGGGMGLGDGNGTSTVVLCRH
jgi:hypothetical protein